MRVGVPEQGTGEHEAPRTAAQNWKPCNGRKNTALAAVVRLVSETPISHR